MAKTIISNNAKKASELYKRADDLYEKISKNFESIESGAITYESDQFKFIKLQSDLKQLESMLTKIDTESLERYIGKEHTDILEHNITFMIENCEYIQKRLMADQYVDQLFHPIKKYFQQFMGDQSNYKRWAHSEEDLTKKFIGMMTHPNNIDYFKGYLKRMALGTMSLKEFKKIFESSKHRMIPLPEQKFESFSEYKSYTYET